ncbi:MAG: AAA family ATPase [Anaerolineae bacterium]|nr:AAA family ATPase [Anaerolineae bacterium]
MSANIVLIGPSGTGKTTVAQLLGAMLNRPVIELDQVRWDYYNEIGYDADYAQQLRKKQGMKGLAAYWKPFDIHAVERVLSDYPSNTIISFGAGHSVYEDKGMLEQAKRLLANHKVILLIPSPQVDESVDILGQRILAKEPHLTAEIVAGLSEINRFFLEHPSNYELATITIFTKDKQPAEVSQKIIELVNSK